MSSSFCWRTPTACLAFLVTPLTITPLAAADRAVIHEIAWMGTTHSANDEWIELHNPGADAVYLGGWTLAAADGAPSVALAGVLPPGGYLLLERTDDASVPGVGADLLYSGALENGGEILELRDRNAALVDRVDAWYAGDNPTRATMSRISPWAAGADPGNWQTSTAVYDGGRGTPTRVSEQLNTVETGPGAVNVYFNKDALPPYGLGASPANYYVNLEDRLIARLNAAVSTIDLATYELNLPDVVAALLARADAGVRVRVIADAKDVDPALDERYASFCLYLERLLRGLDGVHGTADDVAVFSDAPIFAVVDVARRVAAGLPASPADLPFDAVIVGDQPMSGHVLSYGELEREPDDYYARGPQMHNKFVVLDGTWVWTGSWNFTVTGLYGSPENQAVGTLGGNTNHALELRSPELAAIYTDEFEEMWGSGSAEPDSTQARFHGRKVDNTAHVVTVGGRTVEVYFSPGDGAIAKLAQRVAEDARVSARFAVFAFGDQDGGQDLVDELKLLYEGSKVDLVGVRTSFVVEGVFDSLFWDQYWSASIPMTGRLPSQPTDSARWANPAPVLKDDEVQKLHHKYLILDGHTDGDPMVVTGSTNWSAAGEDTNDENLLIIHDAGIADQFLQEFFVRYAQAGGELPCGPVCIFDDGFESGDVSAWSSSIGG